MSELVESVEEVIANIDTLYTLGQSSIVTERDFHNKRIKNGKYFAVLRTEAELRFAPSKFVGYAKNGMEHEHKMSTRDGRETNRAIRLLVGKSLAPGDDGYSEVDRHFLDYCKSRDLVPSKHHRAREYWLFDFDDHLHIPEEINPKEIWEGARTSIQVNRFERSRKAREQCLMHYGYACFACETVLEDVYGILAKEFIHVHHVVPLAEINSRYKISPVDDLRPLCPNCHAIVHRQKDPLSVDELKEVLRNQRSHAGLTL